MGTIMDSIYDKEWAPGSLEERVWQLLVPSCGEEQLETIMGIITTLKQENAQLKNKDADEWSDLLVEQRDKIIRLTEELNSLKASQKQGERDAATHMWTVISVWTMRKEFPMCNEALDLWEQSRKEKK
jgi:protein-tyrosine-phosphatase